VAGAQRASPRRLATVQGLQAPEAVTFDAGQDAYYVSNVNGHPGVKDGNGFISRIRADGTLDSLHFIQGGRSGVTLNGPMGSRARGDTLWVLDIDVLRAFDLRTGASLATVELSPAHATFCNDLAFGPDGAFYVTDMQLHVAPDGKMQPGGPGRILRVERGGRVTIAVTAPQGTSPDGIDWDRRGRRFVVAPFVGRAVQEWRPGTSALRDIAPGKGRFDGVEVEPDGATLITSWNDSSVSLLRGHRLVPRIGPLPMTPADVSMDRRRHRVGIVSLETGRFELWSWP
jgi:sugar lactone lactonase YvrE